MRYEIFFMKELTKDLHIVILGTFVNDVAEKHIKLKF